MEDEMHQQIIESLEKEDQQILEDIKEKQEPKVEEKKDDTYTKSDGELKVEVDENTGVTYVKTNKPNMNPL
jgi:F0F1-type ATP synthase membrane subunit b/b'